jgi:DNA polymerase I
MPTLYLIDGHAQFFRAYHAIRGPMSSPVTKEPTNLTFGFVGMMLKLFREHSPDYVAVVIDVSGDRETFRSELYPEYKANRPPAPQDLHPQVERCVAILKQMGVPVIGVAGVEADDVIATMIKRLDQDRPDLTIRIISKDKDLGQLLNDRVQLFDVHTDEILTVEKLFESKGVKPSQVVDMLTLMGDTVDNVPGVPGIGPKTAAQLITEYGTLDNLLANLDKIKGKRRENLEAARNHLPLSRQLVTLKYDVEFDFDLANARFEAAKLPLDSLLLTLRELGFNRHQDDLKKLVGAGRDAQQASTLSPAGRVAPARDSEGTLFDQATEATTESGPVDPGEWTIVTTADQLAAIIAETRRAGEIAIDTETDGLAPVSAKLCGISLSTRPRTGAYIPTCSPTPDTHLATEVVVAQMKPALEDPAIRKVGHNMKFDLNVFRRAGVRVQGLSFDTMIASYVVDATRSSHKLDNLSLALLQHTCVPITDVIGQGKVQKTFDQAPLEIAGPYAAEDADITFRLKQLLEPQLNELGLMDLFRDVEMPLLEVLAELEWNGIIIDPVELDRQSVGLQKRIEELRRQIIDASPYPFSPDSPKQLAAALFNKPDGDPPGLGLKVIKRNKTGPSTDIEVLEKLAADPEVTSPVPQLIVEYRQLTKLVSTYLVALKDAINPVTGRVHTSFNQTVAATGRLASSDPNLQNIPIRSDVGREIRRAFLAPPGHVLISADYSQIELRILAHLSDDPALIDAFHKGMDIHVAVAAEVFGVVPDAVSREQRNSAKMVNFGIVYGITAYGLARRLGPGTSVERAQEIIDGYKKRFSRINDFLDDCVRAARTQGYVETILKRRRAIPQVESRNPQERALGERVAINTVVQGSAADLIKLAMIDLHRRLPVEHPGVKMLLQIHDELVFEAPVGAADAARAFIVERMSNAMSLKVPLVVESAAAANWGAMK